MLKCNHCDKVYKYESERKRHQKSHFPQFECNVCSKKFSFLSALRRHQKQHERTGSVQCQECGGNFRDDTLLKRHMQYAHRGTYCCSECNTILSSELALRTHSKIHRPESERRFRCTYKDCRKSFNFPHHLKHHELTHTNSKQHFCNVCGKGFIQSHHLKTHYKTHNPANVLCCTAPACGKKFASKCAWKKHVGTHSKLDINSSEARVDSGISSDSNSASEIREQQNDYSMCAGCKNRISRHQYSNHKLICTSLTKDHNDNEKLVEALSKCDNDNKVYESSNSVVLAHCTLDGNEKMKNKVTNDNTILNTSEVKDTATCSVSTEVLDANNNSRASAARAGCACVTKDAPCISRTSDNNSMPEIEYRENGIVKIKDTFDQDIIPIKEVYRENKSKQKSEENDLKYIPFNSCKAVLGNCIVSEDGNMGEGCLCAKMIVDEQQMSAQEIDELTPNPNALWVG